MGRIQKSFAALLAVQMMVAFTAEAALVENIQGMQTSQRPQTAQQIRSIFATTEDVEIQGIMAELDSDADVSPEAVMIPANTRFEVVDRIETEEGLFYAKIVIETGDDEQPTLSYWVNESDLVAGLYKMEPKQEAALNLDSVSLDDAKFAFAQSVDVAMTADGIRFIQPLRNPRRTSLQGYRLHPILRYCKLHAGTDYGAKTGTPVLASAKGTVVSAGRAGGYGIMIVLKHGRIFTKYAHLSRVKPGIRRGVEVKQGNTIGFVGSTGMSTGPHLHYEVRRGLGKGAPMVGPSKNRCSPGKSYGKKRRGRRR